MTKDGKVYVGYIRVYGKTFYQINPVALAHLGERQTEVVSH
jgi:hypothetical protein